MVNEATLIGNVGQDPEVHNFESGSKVAKFSLATSKNYKKDGEKVTTTTWHNIVLWGKLAEIVEKYVLKGDKLYIKGEIQYRDYQDKEGNKRFITEINCFTMQMLGSKEKPASTTSDEPGNTPLAERDSKVNTGLEDDPASLFDAPPPTMDDMR